VLAADPPQTRELGDSCGSMDLDLLSYPWRLKP